jgi:hypothetical protein
MPEHKNHSNGLWRTLAVAFLGVLCTGAASWFAFGANKISREDASVLIENKLESIHVRFDYIEKQHDDFRKTHDLILEKLK